MSHITAPSLRLTKGVGRDVLIRPIISISLIGLISPIKHIKHCQKMQPTVSESVVLSQPWL